MPSEKTDAIVLRVIEFSETSCVVTLFTRDFGKIAALAKGARRPKSAFESALDLLATIRIVFLRKSSEALDLLTEAKLERRFRAATRDLSRLYAGYYVAELLNDLTEIGDPHPDLYHAADQTLLSLDGEADVWPTVLRFELTALRLLGHLPSFDTCVGCGRTIDWEQRVAFGEQAGGVLCEQCRPGQRQVVSVHGGVVEVLQKFSSDDDSWRQAVLAPRFRGEIRGVMNHYLTSLLGRRPRMHGYLGFLASG